ncbi:MAG: F-type H+-transporting ATPase subunit gamma [Acidobacteriaceae bacterium]|jgi:F-type H+-transporting ATPase subunit gamma|nr:F-type H+-transporting ATPase subunit gamma [Acidobacteriaceae bacterium]
MANVLDLKRRIRSVKNTRQITKAMKMVSAAKLRRAQERAVTARPYAQMMASVIQSLMRRIDVYNPETGELRHPLLAPREEKNVLLIVVSGDKGFAGAFNSNIIKAAMRFIAAQNGEQSRNVDIETIGRKARDLFRRRYPAAKVTRDAATDGQQPAEIPEGISLEAELEEKPLLRQRGERSAPIEVTGDHPGMLEKLRFDAVAEIGQDIVDRYVSGEIDAGYVVFNEFRSVISQRVVVERLVPLAEPGEHEVAQAEELTAEERERAGHAALTAGVSLEEPDTHEADEEAQKFGTADVDYIYEQPPEEMLRSLLPRFVATQLYRGMLESVASEHAARMTAMDSASNNASDMIDSLTLTMNRVRQAAITKEIIEIVSGAAAL